MKKKTTNKIRVYYSGMMDLNTDEGSKELVEAHLHIAKNNMEIVQTIQFQTDAFDGTKYCVGLVAKKVNK